MTVDAATSGTVILAATPIGNSLDGSERLKHTLASAEVIAAEDTRKFRTLAARLGVDVSAKVISFFDGNEASRLPLLLDQLRQGVDVV